VNHALERLVKFAEVAGKLKRIERSGWLSQVRVEKPESVADHSFRCAVLAMVMGDTAKADRERLIRMLLLHDLPETHTGDLDEQAKRQMGIKEVKSQEESAMMEIFSILPRELKNNYVSLLEEFQEQRTPEAVLANDIDKIEMVIQALTYEKEGHAPSKLEPFWESSGRAIKTPIAKDLYRIFIMMRARHHDINPPPQR